MLWLSTARDLQGLSVILHVFDVGFDLFGHPENKQRQKTQAAMLLNHLYLEVAHTCWWRDRQGPLVCMPMYGVSYNGGVEHDLPDVLGYLLGLVSSTADSGGCVDSACM
eukprot:6403073-Amphidinium_carterae.1